MKNKILGVTLMEILLVLVVIGGIFYVYSGYMQRQMNERMLDRTAIQVQQILNAATAFYVTNGKWPLDIDELRRNGYLASLDIIFVNPWKKNYIITVPPSTPSYAGMVYVVTDVVNVDNARALQGRSPLAFISTQGYALHNPPEQYPDCDLRRTTGIGGACHWLIASTNVPAQNLNNAPAATFVNVYHSGSCVPVPACPVDKEGKTMTPQVMVAPASVAGVFDDPSKQARADCKMDAQGHFSCNNLNAYPINSYTGYAMPMADVTTSSTPIPTCDSTAQQPKKAECYSDYGRSGKVLNIKPGKYWRVCLSVKTDKGDVNASVQLEPAPVGNGWGLAMGTLVVMTRCQPANEDPGSSFFVWSY